VASNKAKRRKHPHLPRAIGQKHHKRDNNATQQEVKGKAYIRRRGTGES